MDFQIRKVDDIDIRELTMQKTASVIEAKGIRTIGSADFYSLLQWQTRSTRPIAGVVCEEVRVRCGVADETKMRARVAEARDRTWKQEHLDAIRARVVVVIHEEKRAHATTILLAEPIVKNIQRGTGMISEGFSPTI